MNIAFVVHRYHTNLYFTVKSLKEQGHNVIMIVPDIDIYNSLVEDRSLVQPIKINERQLSLKYVLKLLQSIKPDLLIIRHLDANWKLFSYVSFLLGIKRVTYDQIPFYNKNYIKAKTKPYVKRLLKGLPLRRFTPVLGNAGYPESHTSYIPFPIEPLIDISEREYIKNGIVRIMMVGKLGQVRKNHLLLIDALENINAKCSLTIIGTNPNYALSDLDYYKLLEQRVSQTTISEGIRILKDLPYQEILKQYIEHDIFVLPSVQESFAISVLEALAAGCTVISSNDNGSQWYIENGKNGFIFKKNDVADLTDKLGYLLHNPEEISTFGHNALETVKNVHNPKLFAEKIENYT